MTKSQFLLAFLAVVSTNVVSALIPLIDGGKGMPKIYDAWFNDQIAKQANAAISRAVASGKRIMEVQFPPVPNVDEVKFGTPLNQKFGQSQLARDLKCKGGYKPGSKLSRNLLPYANIYWAKRIAGAVKGGALGGKPVGVLTAEAVDFDEIGNLGDLTRTGKIFTDKARKEGRSNEAMICINPGGEETWERLVSAHGQPNCPLVVLNNSYSTTYDLGNKKNFEEVYYLKRISKGWVFRSFPGDWEAYLEKPDGNVELLKSYKTKPSLREVSELVRETSFQRYAMFNDRYMGGRL
jgi:predicted CopG family antitoxin